MVASTTLALCAHLQAAPPNYEDHILPIFEQSCTNCHNPDKQKGDLDLSTYSALLRGGSGGQVAEPGEGGDSKLFGVITHTLKPKMPPKGEKLEKKEADLIRAWIDGGMLENKSGKPRKKKKPAFTLTTSSSTAKPEVISMPQHILLEPVVTSERSSVVADIATSPWAPVVAVTGQGQVLLYHTDTLELTGILPFSPGQPHALSFHPSGKYLLAGGGIGGKSGTTITWNIETGEEILRAGKDFDSCIAASLRSDLGGVSFGGPGKRVKLWDTTTDSEVISIKKHTDWVTQLSYSPDGVLLASGGRGGGVYIWEADTGNPFHTLRAHKAGITDLAWRSDSNLVASASEDGSVLIWEMNNGRQVKKINAHGGGVLSVDWTRNGHLVTSGRDKRVKLWKPDFNHLKELPPFPHIVTRVSFSHDGKRIFAADLLGNITVWDTTTFKQVGTIAANPPTIASRITAIEQSIKGLPSKITAAEKLSQQKTAAHKAAKAHLAKIENDHRQANAKHQQELNQRTQVQNQLNQLNTTLNAVYQQRKEQYEAIKNARQALTQLNKTITDTRNQQQQANNNIKKLAEQEPQLVKANEDAQKAAAAKPEDPALQQAAAKTKAELDKHRNQLAATRSQAQQHTTALAQLQKQQQNPGNQLAAAEKAMKETNAKIKTQEDERNKVQTRRNALNQTITQSQNLTKKLEQQLGPARDNIKPTETAAHQANQQLKHLRHQLNQQQKSLNHWQAATINTQALHLQKEATALADKQHQAMDTFTTLAKEIQALKDPAKLQQKTTRLAQLRQQIDQQAPKLLEITNQAKARKDQYLQALKTK